MARKPDIDFKTYCKVKYDGDEYEATRALSKAYLQNNTAVAGLTDEGFIAVITSMTLDQRAAFSGILNVALREDPEKYAEFIAYCEEIERERERYRQEGKIYELHHDESSNQIGYLIFFVISVIFSVAVIIGIILGRISVGYIVYVIVDAIAGVRLSGEIRGGMMALKEKRKNRKDRKE